MAGKDQNNDVKKAGKSFLSMFKRLFVRDRAEVNILEEEAMRTPGKTVFLKLARNRLAIIGTAVFISVLLFSFIGSLIWPYTPTYIELTNANLRPGRAFLNYPKSLNDKEIVKIVSGISFSVALTSDGELTVWGTECNRTMRNVSEQIYDVPREVRSARIVDIEAGSRHVVCIDNMGNFYGWGYHANDQTVLPTELKLGGDKIVRMAAMMQWTAVLGESGNLYIWGSTQAKEVFTVPEDAAGRIVDFAAGDNNMILMLDDGTVRAIGLTGTEFYQQVPDALKDGSVRVAEIAATNRNVLARDEDGKLYLWGSAEHRLNVMPEKLKGEKAVDIDAGYKNLVVVDDDGEVFVWGANDLAQLEVPQNMSGDIAKVYADYFQFYAVNGAGKIVGAWGNKGYVWGSDKYGRDLFTRVVHGGRISLTVGAIAVVIEIIIAILIGLPSGYFGGWVDHILMRVADVIESIPFLPIAVTLSFVIGHRIGQSAKLFLIMIIIGVLSWTGLARLIRAQTLLEREKDFVLAAKALGIKRIMSRHILPNVVNLIIVNVTLGYASSILTEAGLSFLGFGVQEPTPSWGNMLTGAQESLVIRYNWWQWIIPALFVIAAALSINLIGDALREAIDPKSSER